MSLEFEIALIESVIAQLHQMYVNFNAAIDNDSQITTFNTRKVSVKKMLDNPEQKDTLFKYQAVMQRSVRFAYQIESLVSSTNAEVRARIKLTESLQAKLDWYTTRPSDYPIVKAINDIFGTRIIISGVREYEHQLLDYFIKTDNNSIKRGYIRDQGGYHALHLYMQDTNQHLPWEIQIWDSADWKTNVLAHKQHELIKRGRSL